MTGWLRIYGNSSWYSSQQTGTALNRSLLIHNRANQQTFALGHSPAPCSGILHEAQQQFISINDTAWAIQSDND